MNQEKLDKRCAELDQALNCLGQNERIIKIMEFVIAEIGRNADYSLEDTLPLVLYFANNKDRREFIQLVRGAKPGMVMKKVP